MSRWKAAYLVKDVAMSRGGWDGSDRRSSSRSAKCDGMQRAGSRTTTSVGVPRLAALLTWAA